MKQKISRETVNQIIKFGFVGVIAALIDLGVLLLLREGLGIGVLTSSALSFSVSVVANYILSMSFVFKSKNGSKVKEFIIFVLLSIGGLGVNQVIMWIGTHALPIHYMAVKILAMIIVPVYNFVTRKIFLEEKSK